ncbi:hypothetical protein KDW_64280 [Dictyobacter vulcani]|uniref:Uncharacterized protein n=1 Tax=Dictyobacter vulcani TaxID=2607529 RepID=A0A5J4L471_9CHLR|nr:hypothetical protein KDW_64280 [Dictyobacter vulcani]
MLAEDPLTLTMRIKLTIQALPWNEIASALVALAPKLHADAWSALSEKLSS